MIEIEPLLGTVIYNLAKPVVKAMLDAPELAQGVLANRLDGALCFGLNRTWRAIRSMNSSDPLNHDLQHAARRAYLRACEEMAETAGLSDTAATIHQEWNRARKEIPEKPIGDLDVLLLDRSTAPQQRADAFRQGLDQVLQSDLDRWVPLDPRRKTLERLAREGWPLNGKSRDLHGVMALWFWEEIKENHRAREIFQTQMLVELANREPALQPLADIKEFERRFDGFADQLGRIDRKLDELPEAVAEVLERRNLARQQGPFSRLDARPQGFIQRRELLAWLEERVAAQSGPSLLWGEPGSGKSTLALELGWQLFESGRFSTVVQQFSGRDRGVSIVGPELAAVLPNHNREAEPKVQIELARQWLRERGALVILDDVWDESVLDLAPGPPAQVIYTSRRQRLGTLTQDQIRQVGAFDIAETDALLETRLPGWLSGHGMALRRLAARVERLPYALDVAAGLLQRGRRPRAQEIDYVESVTLRSNIALYTEAARAHTPEAQRLLHAVALCLPEGVWLPFAAGLAGLEGGAVWTAVEALVDASLVRTIDRDEQIYSMHMVLRDALAGEAAKLHAARVEVLDRMLGEWNTDRSRWRDCARVLSEIEPAVDWLEKAGDVARFVRLSDGGSKFGYRTGQLSIANRLIEREKAFFEHTGDRDGWQVSYGNQAGILKAWGRLAEAMALLKKQEELCLDLGNKDGLQASYGNQAVILKAWDRLEEAMALLKKQEELCLELGDKDSLLITYNNQALILQDWGRLAEAMALLKKQEELCLELGNKDGLQASYGNQALILKAWGRLEEAMALHKRKEELCLELGNKDGLQVSYGNQAVILQARGRLEEAMALHKRKEELCLELGNKHGLQVSYGNQALILDAWGRLEEAMALHKRKEELCLELGNRADLANSLANQGLLLAQMNRLDEARLEMQKALDIYSALGMPRERYFARRALDEMKSDGEV